MKVYLITTGALFGLLALVHVWRLIAEWPQTNLAEAAIGVVAAGLCVWAWRLGRHSARP